MGLDILFHSMKVRSEGESYDVGWKAIHDIHLYAACHDAFFLCVHAYDIGSCVVEQMKGRIQLERSIANASFVFSLVFQRTKKG